MKVKTGLRSGNILEDISRETTKAIDEVTRFVSEAGLEADKLADNISSSASSFWACLNNTFS
jgi:hypothetical protein